MAKRKGSNVPAVDAAKKLAEKKDAFIRVATPRVDKALRAVDLVRLCAGPTYAYSDEQKRAICEALQAGVDKVKQAYEGGKQSATGFVMPEK